MATPDSKPWRRAGALAIVLMAVLSVLGCGRSEGRTEILVFAASSLIDALGDVATAYKASNETVTVSLNFASSSTLATQIVEGAPATVFASADSAQMQRVLDAGLAAAPRVFATNRLVIVVPATGSPVESFEDLAKPGAKLVLAAPEVPVGAYSRQFISLAGEALGGNYSGQAMSNVVSEETNVRAVLIKVQLGEADAGVVYETDAAAAGNDVRVVPIPDEFNVIASYPIATITGASEPELGAGFIDFVMGSSGQAILRDHGFGPPADGQEVS